MKLYQACFGKKDNVNWSVFNVSPDAPAGLRTAYEKLQNSNTPQQMIKEDMVDEEGNPICLTEIFSSGGYSGISKTLYGKKDSVNRQASFSHGFITDAENAFDDPNFILTVSDDNFNFTPEQTPPERSVFLKIPPYQYKNAIYESGLDEESFMAVLRCIYVSLDSLTDFPLYLVSKKNTAVLRPLTYCILSSLPYSFRPLLSFSDANNYARAQKKTVMVVKKVSPGAKFYNLDTGETNIRTEEIENDPDRYPFYAILKNQGIEKFNEYIEKLREKETVTGLSGSDAIADALTAHRLIEGTAPAARLSDQELTRLIFEFLTRAPLMNRYIDDYAADIVGFYSERDYFPNESLMKLLDIRGEKTVSEKFAAVYNDIKLTALIKSDNENIRSFLRAKAAEGPEVFGRWAEAMLNKKGGREAVVYYFTKELDSRNKMESVAGIMDEIKKYLPAEDFMNKADSKCFEDVNERLLECFYNDESCRETVEKFMHIYEKINGGFHDISKENLSGGILDRFWGNVDIKRFSGTPEGFVNVHYLKSSSPLYNYLISLENLFSVSESFLSHYTGERAQGSLSDVEKAASVIVKNKTVPDDVRKYYIKKVHTYIYNNFTAYTDENISFWLTVFYKGWMKIEENPLQIMYDLNLSVYTDEDLFRESLLACSPTGVQNIMIIFRGKGENPGCVDYLDPKGEAYKLAKKRDAMLTAYEKGKLKNSSKGLFGRKK